MNSTVPVGRARAGADDDDGRRERDRLPEDR